MALLIQNKAKVSILVSIQKTTPENKIFWPRVHTLFLSLYDKKSTNSLRKKEQAKERKLKLTFINN